MKKTISILLAVAMILAMSITAFAAENTTLTIANSDGREYAGYQLLNLTTSLKEGNHHPENCTGTHSDECYNYAYTVNPAYRAILQQETFDNGGNYLWDAGVKPTTSASVTDEQILKYLSNQQSDNGDVYQTMRVVADRLYRAIKAAGIAAEEPALSGTDEIAQGYWIIADVTNLTGNEANSLVMVDTKGQDALTLNPKTALPTVEKKVKDIEDSEDATIEDNAWHDSADHDIGDTIPFKLTGTLPSNAQYYTTYTMIFHDSLSAALTLDEGTFKVLMYDTKHKADVDTDLNDAAKDVTNFFQLKTEDLDDDCSFEVSCENVFAIEGVTKDTAFVVYYEATLGQNAVLGAAGNPNEVYLEFSNDPYGTGTGTTETDKVTVFTYKVIVNKTDAYGHALEGAGFTLSKKNVDGTYTQIGAELVGGDMTTFEWVGLDDGDYWLVESTVPAGYNKMSDIYFSISAVHSENDGDPALLSLDGGLMGTGVVETGAITKAIENHTGTVLPETGAQGTFMLIAGGSLLVAMAAVFMITRKKMSIYEDE